jgi:hypothetical protein
MLAPKPKLLPKPKDRTGDRIDALGQKEGHLLDFRESISERFPAAFHLI